MSHLPFPPSRYLLSKVRKKINKRYKERWTVGNVHDVSDHQPDALAKSRSCLHFKNERKTVGFYKYSIFKIVVNN